MSSLISDSPMTFSGPLAAAIGLEEAILLQTLVDAAYFCNTQELVSIAVAKLQNKLAFWSIDDLQRVMKSLSDKGIIHLKTPPVSQSQTLTFTFDESANKPTLSSKERKPEPVESTGANRISPYWKPSASIIEKLAQQDIPARFTQQQLAGFITYWQERGEISHAWGAKFMQHTIHQWRRSKADIHYLQPSDQPTTIEQSWQPSPDALEILSRNSINRSFIEDAIPEFVLYWQEKGGATTTWNSKFIQHVKRQWSRYTSALKYDTEPTRIPEGWQPDSDVFDILALANINTAFANDCIKEFVLYWKDSNQLHSSWNTKFLQHVKYCWANQHQLHRQTHEGQQNTSAQNTGATSSFIAKHTDRSWADGV